MSYDDITKVKGLYRDMNTICGWVDIQQIEQTYHILIDDATVSWQMLEFRLSDPKL